MSVANFVSVNGGICFSHGPYTSGSICPQWPMCLSDPQQEEFVNMGHEQVEASRERIGAAVTRRFLEEDDLNKIALRHSADNETDVFDLIFTVRKLRREPAIVMMRPIVLGLQDAIAAHGPITKESISSAAKRVYGRLRGIRI